MTARATHVLSLAHGIRKQVAGDGKLALHRVWSRLRRIQRGESVPEHLVAPKPVLEPVVAELAAWLTAFDGPQRAQLAAFEQDWMPRLGGLSKAQVAQVRTLVRKRIKSKKLAQARDGLLETLGSSGSE